MRAIASPMPDDPPVTIAARSTVAVYRPGPLQVKWRLQRRKLRRCRKSGPSSPQEAAAAIVAASVCCEHGRAGADEPDRGRGGLREVLGVPARRAAEGLRPGRGGEPAR